jgi:exodeoxyribonuclease VII large subunit
MASSLENKLRLSELNNRIKGVLQEAFPTTVWVIAEISEMKVNRSGHCYLVLVEKDEDSDEIRAQARGTIWSYTFRMLRPFFETTAGRALSEGMKVLVNASVEFHPLYGFSLNIRDIDPTYTLGDMARKRLEIINRLKGEGIFEMNKDLELPMVPQKVAVISSSTAAGYQDFQNQLNNNAYGYRFYTHLFPALMQGNQASESIIAALEHIYLYEDFFDVVVIIRGGGSQLDLSCFDDYELAFHITQFPLPVITGIGHEKDDTISDMVAHTRMKTPTAVAEFLVAGVMQFEVHLDELQQEFVNSVEEIMTESRQRLDNAVKTLKPVVQQLLFNRQKKLGRYVWQMESSAIEILRNNNYRLSRKKDEIRELSGRLIHDKRYKLDGYRHFISRASVLQLEEGKLRMDALLEKLKRQSKSCFSTERNQLLLAEKRNELLNPLKILKRGYSVTYHNGKALKEIAQLQEGDEVRTMLSEGTFTSTVLGRKEGIKKNKS